MTNIVLSSIEPQLAQRLRKRAERNGRSLEAEIETILKNTLIEEERASFVDNGDRVDLVTFIRERFDPLGGFEMPDISREPIRNPPTFQ